MTAQEFWQEVYFEWVSKGAGHDTALQFADEATGASSDLVDENGDLWNLLEQQAIALDSLSEDVDYLLFVDNDRDGACGQVEHTDVSTDVGLLVLLWGATASAQTAAPATSYTLALTTSAGVLTSTTVIPATSFTCDLPFTTLGSPNINPTHVEFNDINNAGLACIYTDPGTGPLASLPIGPTIYTATLIATNAAGSSPASAASAPFTHPGAVPGAPTGVTAR